MDKKLTFEEQEKITELYPYLIERVEFFKRKHPYLAKLRDDEIYDAALDGLIYAVQHYDPNKGANIKTYITIKTNYKIIDLLRKHKDLTDKLFDTDLPEEERLGDWLSRDDSKEERQYYELKDLLSAKELTNREIFICLKLSKSHNQREIAKMLGVCNSRISQIVTKIKEYYKGGNK